MKNSLIGIVAGFFAAILTYAGVWLVLSILFMYQADSAVTYILVLTPILAFMTGGYASAKFTVSSFKYKRYVIAGVSSVINGLAFVHFSSFTSGAEAMYVMALILLGFMAISLFGAYLACRNENAL